MKKILLATAVGVAVVVPIVAHAAEETTKETTIYLRTMALVGRSKKAEPSIAIVGTSKFLSKNRFRISQLVSAISKQPWEAAPCVARSPPWWPG
jgi:hypothetical protein